MNFAVPVAGAWTTVTIDQDGLILGESASGVIPIELLLSDRSFDTDGYEQVMTRKRMASISAKDFSRINGLASYALENL